MECHRCHRCHRWLPWVENLFSGSFDCVTDRVRELGPAGCRTDGRMFSRTRRTYTPKSEEPWCGFRTWGSRPPPVVRVAGGSVACDRQARRRRARPTAMPAASRTADIRATAVTAAPVRRRMRHAILFLTIAESLGRVHLALYGSRLSNSLYGGAAGEVICGHSAIVDAVCGFPRCYWIRLLSIGCLHRSFIRFRNRGWVASTSADACNGHVCGLPAKQRHYLPRTDAWLGRRPGCGCWGKAVFAKLRD